jgi:tRNA(Ile)-lysidine synthase
MRILDRVASVIHSHKLINENDRVVVAVSGGADSLALLYILAEIDLPLQLTAVYIDHGLRPRETPQEQKTIEDSCLALNIPFSVRRVNVHDLVAQGKKSLEEAARLLRYQALEEFRHEYRAKIIAVGHTADDQVEEFFIRLIRGSSSRGLAGMRLQRDTIIRPLLFEKKAQLVEFLVDRNIHWCLDSSNQDRQFLRNRVRLDLLPLLEESFNPALRTTILHQMDVLAEEDKFLQEQTEIASGQCVHFSEAAAHGDGSGEVDRDSQAQLIIKREMFLANHPAIRRRILEKSCWRMAVRPTYEQICTLADYLENGKNGSELHLAKGVRAEKSADELRLSRPLLKGVVRGSKQPSPTISLSIPGPGIYPVPGANKELALIERAPTAGNEKNQGELWVDLEKLSFPLLLRSFQPGEKFSPCGGPGRKKISRYFNARKIPPKERPAWPVLLSADRIVALVGLELDDSVRTSPSTGKVLSIQWRDLQERKN